MCRLIFLRVKILTFVVGGEILDLALGRAKPHARFVMCGAISQYNKAKADGPKVKYFHCPVSVSQIDLT